MNSEQNESKPIILLHGLIGSLSDKTLLEPFGHLKVLTPDLLGYGENIAKADEITTLKDQVEHVISYMDDRNIEKANIVGHSVGGAIAVLVATHYPERVCSLISVEGNMTPPDAFWSANLSDTPIQEIQSLLEGYKSNISAWISDADVKPDKESIRIATDWLNNQSAETLKAQAGAVVSATSDQSDFLDRLNAQIKKGLELHLVAGSNSRNDWHVPQYIIDNARSFTLIPDTGHLMMLQSPEMFAQAIIKNSQ